MCDYDFTLSELQRENLLWAESLDPDEVEVAIQDGDFGTLMDGDTAESIRPATLSEAIVSLDISCDGIFEDEDGRGVYVQW